MSIDLPPAARATLPCAECAAPVAATASRRCDLAHGRQQRVFCSRAHRQAFYARQQQEPGVPTTWTCQQCQVAFPLDKWQRQRWKRRGQRVFPCRTCCPRRGHVMPDHPALRHRPHSRQSTLYGLMEAWRRREGWVRGGPVGYQRYGPQHSTCHMTQEETP